MKLTHPVIVGVAAAVAAASLTAAFAAAESAPQRPRLEIAAPAEGCPAATGQFVVLLGGQQGILVLSAAQFPGGRRVGSADGGPVVVAPEGGSHWKLARAAAPGANPSLWAARYPFLGPGGRGCVTFERGRFAAAGDLATYVHWLTERVYLTLPPASRLRWPALELRQRTVRLRVEQADAGPLDIGGREGGTLAYRTRFGDVVMLQPFVLDQPSSTVALDATMTPAAAERGTPPQHLGWLVASSAAPAFIDHPAATIIVTGISASGDDE